ncbi:MAG: hypothetical protein GC162_04765 [Planctomycetes bacterium]|nr:hypothetical protein [Planctomycetota bacterium]
MKIGRLIAAMIAMAVFVMVFDFVLHQELLSGVYGATASFWRKPEEMILPAMTAGQVLSAVMFCLFYVMCAKTTCAGSGLKFGAMFGLAMAPGNLIMYGVEPLPGELFAAWAAGNVIELALAGLIVGAIYGRSKPMETGA